MAKRPRFSGDDGPIVQVLAESADAPGFLRYSQDHEAQLQVGKIMMHRHMWQGIRGHCPSLAFAQKHCEGMFRQVYELKAD
eukprot:9695650-Alexandrium_andersonii.AAC.1